MKGSTAVIALVIVGFLVICGMLAYIFFIKPQTTSNTNASSVNSSADSTAGVPVIPVKDFAPGMPMAQKTTILIMSNDSSEEKYIVPASEVNTYVKQLPPGFHVVSKNP